MIAGDFCHNSRMSDIGFLIIGNEILSGRTREKNLSSLSELLARKGLAVAEARIVRDSPPLIAAALRQMRETHAYIFSSGGIGPTHDDVTVEGVALAFDVPVEENAAAAAVLSDFYTRRGEQLTAARRRMARAPAGAAILKSDFAGAPGFVMDNVFICAGVPAIFNLMAAAALRFLPDLPCRCSAVLRVEAAESTFAEKLAELQQRRAELEIGSYPREEKGQYYCHLVFGGTAQSAVAEAAAEMMDFFCRAGVPCRQIN